MDVKNLYMLSALYVLIGMVSAVSVVNDAQEIAYQNINYGEYIQQYAIIKVIEGTSVYTKPCQDCTCTLTVKDLSFVDYLRNEPMTELQAGLFGYMSDASKIEPGNYIAYANCTSIIYGTGIATSNIKIYGLTSAEIDTSTISTNVIPTNICQFGDIGCYLDNAVSNLLLLPTNLFNLVKDTIKNSIFYTFINPIFGIMLNFLDIIVNTLTWFYDVIILMFNDPGAAVIKVIMDGWKWIALALGLWFLPFMFIQVFIIAYVLFARNNKSGFDYIYGYLYGNYQYFKLIIEIVYRGLTFLINSIPFKMS